MWQKLKKIWKCIVSMLATAYVAGFYSYLNNNVVNSVSTLFALQGALDKLNASYETSRSTLLPQYTITAIESTSEKTYASSRQLVRATTSTTPSSAAAVILVSIHTTHKPKITTNSHRISSLIHRLMSMRTTSVDTDSTPNTDMMKRELRPTAT